MFTIKGLRSLKDPDAEAYSPSQHVKPFMLWLGKPLSFWANSSNAIKDENEALRQQVLELRAEISELSSQLQYYGAREKKLYEETWRHEEISEMLKFLSERDGFKYTHIAAEQKIQMMEKELVSLRQHCNSGWESYRSLEKQWMKFIYEYVDNGSYPQMTGRGNENGCSEED